MESPASFRRIHLLNLAILAWIWVFSLLRWPELPERIPIHFTLSGEPDRWASKSWEHWFLVPLVAVGLAGLMYASARLALRFPRFVNLPSKRSLMDLPASERVPILALIADLVYRIAALVNAQFALMQLSTDRVARGLSEALPWYVRVSSVAIVVLTLLLVLSTMLRIRSMIGAAEGRFAPDSNPGSASP